MISNRRIGAVESSFTQSVDGVNQQAVQHGHNQSTQMQAASAIDMNHRRTKKSKAHVASPVVTTSADKVAWNAALLLAIETVQQQHRTMSERELKKAATRLLVFNPSTGTVTVYNSAEQASSVRRRLTHLTHLQR